MCLIKQGFFACSCQHDILCVGVRGDNGLVKCSFRTIARQTYQTISKEYFTKGHLALKLII